MEVTGSPYSRNVFRNFTKIQTFPYTKEMIAKMGEAIIFNTDIYHSFDNTASREWRRVLTLRLVDDNISFQQAKEILFPL
jgi:bifunctional pyridoxal-dependent enzyme with beta-cystathionase and maltose regulon repressor activities